MGRIKVAVGRFAPVQQQHPPLGVKEITEHRNAIGQGHAGRLEEKPAMCKENVQEVPPDL